MGEHLALGSRYSANGAYIDWNPLFIWVNLSANLLLAFACIAIAAAICYVAWLRNGVRFLGSILFLAASLVGLAFAFILDIATFYTSLHGVVGVLKLAIASAACAGVALLLRHLRGIEPLLSAEQGQLIEAELERSKRQLSDSTQETRAIIESMADGLVTIDEKGEILFANPSVEKVFGYTPKALVGSNVKLLMRHSDSSMHDQHLSNYLRTGVRNFIGRPREVIARNEKGEEFPIEIQVTELSHSGGRKYCAVARDISERKQMEKMKSEFVSTVSHELRTPLTSIRGSLGLIEGGPDRLPDGAQKLLRIASSNCNRLIALVNDILDLEKLGSGTARLELERFEVGKLTREIVGDHIGTANEAGVSLQLNLPEAACYVQVDRNRFGQILGNLISNAAKFSDAGDDVIVSVVLDDAGARISVIDNGPGVPAQFHGKIFERFAQADSSSKRAIGGTGLGLHISRQLAEMMGGQLDFESAEGEGATFWFTVPGDVVRRAGNYELVKAAEAGELPVILHVEDDHALAEVLSMSLSQWAQVVSVASVAEAKSLLHSMSFAAVVIDWDLPDGHGEQLIADGELIPDNLPIFGLSASDVSNVHPRVTRSFTKSRVSHSEMIAVLRNAISGAEGAIIAAE